MDGENVVGYGEISDLHISLIKQIMKIDTLQELSLGIRATFHRKLDNNNIGDKGGKIIGAALKGNHKLHTLTLGNMTSPY